MKNKLLFLLLVAGLGSMILLLAAPDARPPHASPRTQSPAFELDLPTAREIRTLVQSYGQRMDHSEHEIHSLNKQMQEFQKRLEETAQSRTSIQDLFQTALEPTTEIAAHQPLRRVRKLQWSEPSSGAPPLHIPAGSFGEATLLTGVYAPVQDEALPVLIRLDTALIGPTRSRVPLQDAFLIGKAQGDANSERAVIQLHSLSYVAPSGKTIETPVNGWAIDNDGVQGLIGTYVWRAKEVVTLASVTGGLAAGAEALASKETGVLSSALGSSTTLTGDAAKFAGNRAAAGALSKLSDIAARRMDEILPAIYVPNGKSITIAFLSGVTLTGLPREDASYAQNHDPFSGLDAHR